MNPRRWVHRSAWILNLVVLAAMAAPANAQFLEPSRFDPDLPPDPIARSIRLLGMGRMTMLSDHDNRFQFWEFAGLPVGLYDSDSISTLDVRPTTGASSSAQDLATTRGVFEQQSGASREQRFGIEAIRRPGDGTAYGLLGDLGLQRTDALYTASSERRSKFNNPLGIPVIAGRLPWISPQKLRYALYGIFGLNDSHDEYRRLSSNGAGEYVDHDGTLMTTPNYFDPDNYFVRRMGGGAGLAYVNGARFQAALGGHIVSNGIEGTNDGDRYASEIRERRPIFTGNGAMFLRMGSSLQLGAEGEAWSSSSQSTYVFTISPSGGPGPTRPPLAGRGDLSKRKEDALRGRVRARLTSGPLELNAGVGRYQIKTRITPAPLSSPNSFNSFRLVVFSQVAAADTIGLPEDVLSSRVDQKDWEAVGGAALHFGHARGLVGGEYHYVKRHLDLLTGQGAYAEEVLGLPQIASEVEGVLWDVRTGAEYRCTEVLTGRLGYIYRSRDDDRLTALNEFTSNTVTGGFTLRPAGSVWNVQAGYAFEWGQADYGDPALPRSTRQQLGMQIHWGF